MAGGRGDDFDLNEHQSVKIGITTINQVIETFGEPTKRYREERNGLDSEVLVWQFAEITGDAPDYKKSVMEFFNGKLYGYNSFSTESDPPLDLSQTQRQRIQKGATDKKTLLGLIGKNTGETSYPSNMINEGRFPQATLQRMKTVIFFTSVFYRQKPDSFFSQRVVREYWIALGAQDVVIDTSYFETAN